MYQIQWRITSKTRLTVTHKDISKCLILLNAAYSNTPAIFNGKCINSKWSQHRAILCTTRTPVQLECCPASKDVLPTANKS